MEVLGGHGLDGREVVDAGVVDEDADGAELLRDCLDQRTDGIGISDVGLHGDSLAAGLLDFGDNLLSASLAARIVDGYGCALRCQLKRDSGANTLRCSGDQCDFTLKFAHNLCSRRSVIISTFRQLSN